ncbi:MAG: hypothetical protein AAF502_07240 [Bacteroidota bacterium]
MKKILVKTAKVLGILLVLAYLSICFLFYVYQEEAFIFLPEKLEDDYQFSFEGNYEEILVNVDENVELHSMLFKADSSKGVIFYLHGNGGSMRGWGEKAPFFTDLGYDLFMIDYRG